MVILLVVFLFQFSVSCSCLAFSAEQQENVLCSSWETMDGDARKTLEQHMDCCGLIDSPEKRDEFSMDASLCTAV
ncbi:hypothetical protein SRHO_G00271850 [Serrasalmus rhombeus]